MEERKTRAYDHGGEVVRAVVVGTRAHCLEGLGLHVRGRRQLLKPYALVRQSH